VRRIFSTQRPWMALLLGTVLVVGVAGESLSATAVARAPAFDRHDGSRSCGRASGGGHVWAVRRKGHITCTRARRLLKAYWSPDSKSHTPSQGGRSQWYTTVPGGWTCGPMEHGWIYCSHVPPHHSFTLPLVEFGVPGS
jgi:hypothetical protein